MAFDSADSFENMYSLKKILLSYPSLTGNFRLSLNINGLRHLHISTINRKNKFSNVDKNEKGSVSGIISKYELFSEDDNSTILDIEEERHKIQYPEQKQYDKFKGINITRGKTGVFDIEELVDILKRESAKDIFVCEVPSEHCYVDYIVIVTGKSTRHMIAIAELIRKVFKIKVNQRGIIPIIEGKTCKKWMALDLGNIVLHIFSEDYRKEYDLESLWCLGKEYDSLSHESSSSIVSDYSVLLSSLTPKVNKTV